MPAVVQSVKEPPNRQKQATGFGRTHIGIYTVLNESFSSQEVLLVLKYIEYSCDPQPSP